MFENELCKHPAINHVAYSPHTYNETHHWLKAACLLGIPKELFHGNKIYSGYGSRQGARQYLIDCIRGNVSDFAIPATDEDLVFKGWDAMCRKFAKPIFFEKSPQYPHHWAALDLIMRWAGNTEFDVRFICLIRNPMAVMYSARELFSTDPFKRQFGWALCYRNILAMKELVGNDRFHLVRYEDLIAQPQHTFATICDYLGLKHEDAMGKKVHARSLDKWVKDPSFTLRLDESVVRIAEHFGYAKQELYNPPKPGLTTGARLRRNIKGTLKLAHARLIDRIVKPLLLSTSRKK